MGMTIRDGQREYFYDRLDQHFPGLKHKYIQAYGNRYICNVPEAGKLEYNIKTLCNSLSIPLRMNFYKSIANQQLKLF
jgi:hypothetical protein